MAKAPLKDIVAGKTEPGELAYVTISGEGKENMNGVMQYVANIIFEQDSKEFQRLKADIEAYWAENKPAGFKRPAKSNGIYYNDPILGEDGEPEYDEDGKKLYDKEGKMRLTFKTGTVWPDGKPKKVRVYNSKNAGVSLGDRLIGNGTIGALQGKMGIYVNEQKGKVIDAGVTLYLDKVQIRKFVEYAGDQPDFTEADDDEAFTGFEGDFGEEDAPAADEAKKARL